MSNLQFKNSAGDSVALTLDDNEFQLNHPAGSVALIDLTSNTEGSCATSAVASSEGTARTNSAVRGTTAVGDVASISFDVGVPQAVMKAVIASQTTESAPSPLNEMYWSWASGYRHLVFNFIARDAMNNTGGGYVHVGSMNCGPMDGKALSDRESCQFVNTPKFLAPKFNLSTDKVTIDLGALLNGIDYIAPIYDSQDVYGDRPGRWCLVPFWADDYRLHVRLPRSSESTWPPACRSQPVTRCSSSDDGRRAHHLGRLQCAALQRTARRGLLQHTAG